MSKAIYHSILITGQIPSGKNSVVVTRNGLRFPSKRFVTWRKHALECIENTKNTTTLPLSRPISVKITYCAADKRRRDAPGMIDALWHVLEKGAIVTDDTFLGGTGKTLNWIHIGIDKERSGVLIEIYDEN